MMYNRLVIRKAAVVLIGVATIVNMAFYEADVVSSSRPRRKRRRRPNGVGSNLSSNDWE